MASSMVGLLVKFGEFAQGVPKLWRFYVGDVFSTLSSGEKVRCEYILEVQKWYDLLSHHLLTDLRVSSLSAATFARHLKACLFRRPS